MLGDRAGDDGGDLLIVAPGGATWRPSCAGSSPSAATTFWRTEVSEPSGMCSPIRSMAATSAFASTGSNRAGRANESPYGSGSTVDHPVAADLGVQDVGAGAEVDDVQH